MFTTRPQDQFSDQSTNLRAAGGYQDEPSVGSSVGSRGARAGGHGHGGVRRPHRRRIRWLTVIGIPLVTVIIIFTVVSFTIKRLHRYKVLESEKGMILKHCTAPKLESGMGYNRCKDACKNFEHCCDIMDVKGESLTNQCYQENVFQCFESSKCHGLQKDEDGIPPAPTELESACSATGLKADEGSACLEMCNQARCCWDQPKIPSCYSTKYETCQDYSYCQNLRSIKSGNNHILYVAPSNLKDICAHNKTLCKEECESAHCCTQPHSDCYRDNFIPCLSYIPCNMGAFTDDPWEEHGTLSTTSGSITDITIEKAYSKFSKPGKKFFEKCSVEEIFIEGSTQKCHEFCRAKECCWQSGIDNCFGDDPLGCIHHIDCKLLSTPRSSLDWKTVTAGIEGNKKPKGRDRPVEAHDIQSIYKDLYDTNGNYKPAKHTEEKGMTRDRTFMHAVCDATTLFSDRTPCETECKPSMPCCDPYNTELGDQEGEGDNGKCFIEEMENCYDYSRCHTLHSNVYPASLQLDDNCSPQAIARDRKTCEDLCEQVQCCWHDNVPPCYDTKFTICLDYGMCQNLRPEATISVSPKWLDDECKADSSLCHTECRKTEFCCSNQYSECYRNNFLACISYASCPSHKASEIMKPLHSKLPPVSPDVETFCSRRYVNFNGTKDCKKVCKHADCCYENGIDENCFGDDPLGCLEHHDCAILHRNRFPEYRDEVDKVCTDELVLSGDQFKRAPCELICDPVKTDSCCDPFHAGDDSCYYDNLQGCFSYSRCHVLNEVIQPIQPESPQFEKIPEIPADNSASNNEIDSICSLDAIETDRSQCEAVCAPARCCWDYENTENPIFSCIHTKFSYCLDYVHCQNLRKVTTTVHTYEAVNATKEEPLKVAELNLDQLCKDRNDRCFGSCASASKCCNHIYSDCFRDNFMSCLSYSVCKNYFGVNLHVLPVNNVLSKPPTYPFKRDMSIVCNSTYIAEYNDIECRQICAPADCCWKHGFKTKGNCFGEDPLGCMQYIQCRVIFGRNGTETVSAEMPESGGRRDRNLLRLSAD